MNDPRLNGGCSTSRTTVLFVIRSLGTALSFSSVQGVLTLLFGSLSSHASSLVKPVPFCSTCTTVFRGIRRRGNTRGDVCSRARRYVGGRTLGAVRDFRSFARGRGSVISGVLMATSLAILSTCCGSLAGGCMATALFLGKWTGGASRLRNSIFLYSYFVG